MNEYKVGYFSGVDWGWTHRYYLATNEDEVLESINKICPPQYREKNGEDSLEITIEKENVKFPYFLRSSDY